MPDPELLEPGRPTTVPSPPPAEPPPDAVPPPEPPVDLVPPPEPPAEPLPPPPEPDPVPPAEPTLRDQMVALGLAEFAQLDSDAAAAEHLARGYQVASQAQPVIAEYQQHRDEFQQWQQERAAAAKPPGQPAPPPESEFNAWTPPGCTQEEINQCEFDEPTGQYRHKFGASPAVAAKVNAHLAAISTEREQMWKQGPAEYMRPTIEHFAEQVATRIIDQRLATAQQQQTSASFWQDNSDWMLAKSPDGQPAFDPAGQPLLSDPGRVFKGNLERLQGMLGDTVPEMTIQQLALEMTQVPNGTVTPPPTPVQQREAANVSIQKTVAGRRLNHGGTIPAPGSTGVPPQNGGMSLRERMAANMAAEGIT